MNKKVTLSLVVALISAVGIGGSLSYYGGESYQSRSTNENSAEGYVDYISKLRNNQITGTVSEADVQKARLQVRDIQNLKYKAEWPITWEFAGPDNIGGRTRSIVIDRNDPSILYSGGVSGGIFKSDNRGASWYPLEMEGNGFGVVSMAQTTDGALYAGTGENFISIGGFGTEGSVFSGNGMYKSTDGQTFELLNNTTSLGYIASLEAHPSQNVIFAGTQAGLYYSDDAGGSWNRILTGNCTDIKINKNGVILIYRGGTVWRSTSPLDGSSYSRIQDIGPNIRAALAWSESDPNYAYVVTAGSVDLDGNGSTDLSSGLNGLYRSTDGGVNFTKVVERASTYFTPFSSGTRSQGWYDICIGVHPRNKDRVFIGGIGFAEWTLEKGPEMVGNTGNGPLNPFGIHADKHIIVFDNSGTDPIMYVGSDGGVSRTTNEDLNRYADRVINYSTTQFYDIAASPDGDLLGATQDNGNLLIQKESFPRKPSVDIFTNIANTAGADGLRSEISQWNPDVMFAMAQRGFLGRTVDGGQNISLIWDNRVRTAHASNANGRFVANDFATGLHYWEPQDIVNEKLTNGSSPALEAQYTSRLFLKLNNGIWMCNNAHASAHNPENPSNETVRWFRVSSVTTNIDNMATTRDGDVLFAGTESGRLYRTSGLNKANFDTTELSVANAISDSLTTIDITSNMSIGGRYISDVYVDPSDDNRVMVTLANYGNTRYVYITENALDPVPNWTDITTNLPNAPVYSCLISADDPSILIVGTEFGIFATDNGFSSNPTWTEMRDGANGTPMPSSPVFAMDQVAAKPWAGHTVYAGTHGMGMWQSSSLLTNIKEEPTVKKSELTVYPNPAHISCTMKTDIRGEYTLNVYDVKGSLVSTAEGRSNGNITLNTRNLKNGNYFVEVIGVNAKAVSKMIVQH